MSGTRIWIPGWACRSDHVADQIEGLHTPFHTLETLSLADMVDRLNHYPKPLQLIGHSMGGFLAVNLAKLKPEWMSSLILIGITDIYPKSVIRYSIAQMTTDPDAYIKDFFKAAIPDPADRDLFFKTVFPNWQKTYDTKNLIQGLKTLGALTIDLRDIPVPYHLVHSNSDPIADPQRVMSMAEQVGKPVHWVEGGHYPFLNPKFWAQFQEVLRHV